MAASTAVREQLRSVLQGRRVLLVRHGNTAQAQVDAERQLTEKGEHQCARFREAFAAELAGVRNVLASPVARTFKTASLLMASSGTLVRPVDDLYFGRPWRTKAMEAGENVCGYAPLQNYLDGFPGVYDAAAEAMAGAVAAASAELVPGDVMIVGHAGYLSLVALEVVEALAPNGLDESQLEAWRAAARKTVLEANVGEVCGFEIGPAGARYLRNPKATDFAAAPSHDAFVSVAS
eukprot:TRINITY_DN28566_c0_g1_i1.p1 TRINITY_DN28566_c0_g1~~TRINITY_DN28566_c0_g1_i1.p1  ORF type:complete len:254 (-),score=60.58 TRINITY_DN28566_c0_g1_i1:30-734(-)